MNFEELSNLSEQELANLAQLMLQHWTSPTDAKNWIKIFLDLEYPNTTTDTTNNSNPLDAIWQVYNAFEKNDGEMPGAIWLAARESLKTVSVAILEVVLILHFKLDIAHASAIESQSQVCLRYIDGFFRKIKPLMDAAGWIGNAQNKRTFEFVTPDGKQPFIKVVVATAKGMNSLHANLLVVDELDLADPAALNEGRNIVGFSRNMHGFTLFLSTRKYAFGNMATAIEKASEMNYKVLQWNLLDVTEYCPPERHLPNEPKEDRYVKKGLPLEQKSREEFELLPEIEKSKWELVKDVHAGCKNCALLPICKMHLSKLPTHASKGFYKPIKAIIQKFKENPPDIAEAQLLCWKPGSEGLVYPRFSSSKENGNVITYEKAWEELTGETRKRVSEIDLLAKLHFLDIPIHAAVDWGYTHDSVIMVAAIIPNGDIWILDTYASPGLEFEDVLEVAKTYRDKFKPRRWFVDQAMPSHIKSFRKNGMPCPKFTKDVMGGIEAVRSKILSADGKRRFKVLFSESNKKTITAITKHKFLLDGQGNPTLNPDDERGVADICDTTRYLGQNLFPVRGPKKPAHTVMEPQMLRNINPNDPDARKRAEIASQHEEQMRAKLGEILGDIPSEGSTKKRGGFFWSF